MAISAYLVAHGGSEDGVIFNKTRIGTLSLYCP